MSFKRGYEKGIQTLEIIDGNIEVVVWNNSGSNFYCYRFKPKDVFGIRRIDEENRNLFTKGAIESYVRRYGYTYDILLQELLTTAIETGMRARED